MTAVLTRRRQPGPLRPTLRLERALLREGHTLIAGMDEVGRGALAGPVSVGVVLVDAGTRSAPVGLKDSKLLRPREREELAPRLRRWCRQWAVGHADATEVDRHGIIAALRLAGTRALNHLAPLPDLVLLDGNHDWLTPPQPSLFEDLDTLLPGRPPPPLPVLNGPLPDVRTLVKADLRCTAVAAASVLAKTTRDAMMVGLAGPEDRYGWQFNKGYSAPAHLAALRQWGPSALHRRSWQLPSIVPGAGAVSS